MKDNFSETATMSSMFLNQENSPCHGIENISIYVNRKRLKHHKKTKKLNFYDAIEQVDDHELYSKRKKTRNILKRYSVPEITKNTELKGIQSQASRSETVINKCHNPFKQKFIVNALTQCQQAACVNPFHNPVAQVKWRVYRCQLNTQDESCCCSCNSDAMFEVMKSLYDCYKKKNCDHCNCILCGHLPREERKLGEMRKSGTALSTVGIGTVKQKAEKEKKQKIKKEKTKVAEAAMVGKTPAEKEKILKELAIAGAPLPEGKTASEKELIKKVKTQVGLPSDPKTTAEKEKMKKAELAGIITPLEGKSASQKEKILKEQAKAGIPLPEGRTASEKALIAKVKAETKKVPSKAAATAVPSDKLRKAKAAGLMTPLEGKSPEQKEKILRGLTMAGIPLPEAKTASENKLIEKVKADVGIPPEPKSSIAKKKYQQAMTAGVLTPLEGKSKDQKEKILRKQAEAGIALPEGRTVSEKALIAKVKATTKPPSEGVPSKVAVLSPSEKLRKAKAAGLITPLDNKTPQQKEKILKGLAMQGIALPEGKTASEKKLIEKVRADVGLPLEPKSAADKEKYKKALETGKIIPLEGKSPAQKEKILKAQLDMGLPLPEGRTPSEKALINKVKATATGAPAVGKIPSEKLRKAKAAGLLTPLSGKSPEQREKILKGLAKEGLPLPEGKSPSERVLIEKVKAETARPEVAEKRKKSKAVAAGVPALPQEKAKQLDEKTAKVMKEGKGPSDECICGLLTPESQRVSVGKAVAFKTLSKMPSEKLRKAKAAGLLTPLTGKSPEQKEKILEGLAKQGLPLPEAKTASEKIIIDKVRIKSGLPPEPKTPSLKEKYAKAQAQGILTPLEGKSAAQKEKILKAQAEAGIPLPEGRTPSEKAIISKVTAATKAPTVTKIPSEKLRKAKAAGLLTPLAGKSPEQQEKILEGLAKQGLPLPEGKTASEKKIIAKVRAKSGLPPQPKTPSMKEKYEKAQAQGILTPLEGKSAAQKEKNLKAQVEAGIPLPEGRTTSEKAIISKVKAATKAPSVTKIPSEKLRKAKAAGLLTPLAGKSPEQREKILKGQAKEGLPLPEGKSPSEKALIEKVKAETAGPEAGEKRKKSRAVVTGVPALPPKKAKKLDEKTAKVMKESKGPSDECICGLLTPESQRVSVGKAVAAKIPSEKLKAAKAAGLLTPLTGKSSEQKEKILVGLTKQGLPLPEAKTASEKKIIDKVRAKSGLPPEPKTPSLKEKYAKAQAQGILTPLEGKSAAQKEKILKAQAEAGIPLPEGRTPSEKAIISKVKAGTKESTLAKIPSEKLRKAQAAGLLTPLAGKSSEQKEKILEGLAKQGLPLPEGKTVSEKKIINKVRAKSGLPPEPKTPSLKEKYAKAQAQGILTPLEGKSAAQKEKILKAQVEAGIPLPEGRTTSEKAIISKIKATTKAPTVTKIPSEKLRKAKAAGLLTPLAGKSPEQREKILKGLVKEGLPLPEGKSPSEKALIEKMKAETAGPEAGEKRKKSRAVVAGGPALPTEKAKKLDEKTAKVMKEGKGPSDECICGLLTPESQRVSVGKTVATKVPSEKLKAAKAAGLLTPLAGKSPEQKQEILEGLAKQGLPLPEAKTASEKKIIDKVRAKSGLPPEPKTPSLKEKYAKAQAQGILTPLEGKSAAQKEKILRAQAKAGIPLPEGRTTSEKALITKVKTATVAKVPSEKIRKAKAAGLLTPLAGKTPEQREKILKSLAKEGLPLPEAKSPSEKALIEKVKAETAALPSKITLEKAIVTKAQAEVAAKPSRKAAGPPTPLSEQAKVLDQKTAKIIKEGKGPSDECICGILTPESEKMSVKVGKPQAPTKIPSEKLKKAKAAGLLTPLEGKSSAQKEKILRGLAMQGLPLPEGKTGSEKKLVNKVRADLAVSPEPKSGSTKVKYDNAIADGLILPLEGKSPVEKEKIIRAIADRGIALPEGRTPSEKALIAKVKTEPRGVPDKVSSEKLRKAKAAGLLTPLEGKSAPQKEKILKGLAKAGIPLPEGKSTSEKAMVQKVKTEFGIPKAVTPSEKEIVRKAKTEGLLTPLAGKTPAQQEKILKGLAETGLPMPEGKTASTKALIKKIRTAAGLPAEPTPSEKLGKIKTKSKKVGIAPSRRSAKRIGAGISKAGIVEEFQDILKTTTCDRGCGCDKKKIRFKHSYVKIRVTSPDISSLCPCPDECVPGVKGGVFTDSEGIKVTVGSAIGVPSFPKAKQSRKVKTSRGHDSERCAESLKIRTSTEESYPDLIIADDNKNTYESIYMNANFSNESLSTSIEPSNIYKDNYPVSNIETKFRKYGMSTSRYLIACSESYTSPSSDCLSFQETLLNMTCIPSLESVEIIRTESSLGFSTSSDTDIATISIVSFHESSIVSTSSHYLCYQKRSTSVTSVNVIDSEYSTNVIDYSAYTLMSESEDIIKQSISNTNRRKSQKKVERNSKNNDTCVFRMSHTSLVNATKASKSHYNVKDNKHKPIIVINNLNGDEDILKMVDEILAKREIANASSIFVVVPTSDEYDTDITDSASSTICIRLSENFFNWKNSLSKKLTSKEKQQPKQSGLGFKISPKAKRYTVYSPTPQTQNIKLQESHQATKILYERTLYDKDCQVEIIDVVCDLSRCVSMDTTQDRPCCCLAKEPSTPDSYDRSRSKDQCVANVVSELITPMIVSQGVAEGLSRDAYLNVTGPRQIDHTTVLARNQATSVSLCNIQGRRNCHGPDDAPAPYNGMNPNSKGIMNSSYNTPLSFDHRNFEQPHNAHLNLNTLGKQPCKCTSVKTQTQGMPTTRKNYQSTGCGPLSCKSGPTPIIHLKGGTGENPCGTCGRPTMKDGRKISCLCSGKEKKVTLPDECPCEANKVPAGNAQTMALGDYSAPTKTTSTRPCLCNELNSKDKKKNKNIICECPEVVEEEEPESFDELEPEIDEGDNRKMQSDMTQTTSGFKFDFKKRQLQEEMSFEDALKYFEEHSEDDGCYCDENGSPLQLPGNVTCDCPEEEPLAGEQGSPGEVLKGLKLHIGGKGSGSKGLSGICCFDMLQESNGLIQLQD